MLSASSNLSKIDTIALPSARAAERDAGDCSLTIFLSWATPRCFSHEGRWRRDDGLSRRRIGVVWLGGASGHEHRYAAQCKVRACPGGQRRSTVPDYACAPSGLLALGCPTKARSAACSGTAKSCGANGLMAIVPLFRCGGWGRRTAPRALPARLESGGLRTCPGRGSAPPWGRERRAGTQGAHTSCWFQEILCFASFALDRGSRSARKSSLHSPGIRHTTDRRTAERSQRAKRQGLLCLGATMPPASSTYPRSTPLLFRRRAPACPGWQRRSGGPGLRLRSIRATCAGVSHNGSKSGVLRDGKIMRSQRLDGDRPAFSVWGVGTAGQPHEGCQHGSRAADYALVSRPRERPTLGGANEEPGPRSHTSCWFQEILCFANFALDPGSRSTRARALAALARDTSYEVTLRASERKRFAALARALAASTSRSRGGAFATSESSSSCADRAT